MTMSDDQVKELLEWFANFSETRKKWAGNRKEALERNHEWIQPDVIKKMSDDELEKTFLDYYRNGAGEKQTSIKYTETE
jgi:hypothetical protein